MKNEIDYVKIKIPSSFDLVEQAKKYNIDKEELRDFHNSHCSISEYIFGNEFIYLENLYLSKDIYSKWLEQQLLNTQLTLPSNKSIKKYGVIINYSPQNVKIHFEVDVLRDGNVVEINKDKSYLNDKIPDLLVEQLVEKASNVLYPLQLSINEYGSFTKVLNKKDILIKWENEVQPELVSYYNGAIAEDIIDKMNHIFSNLDENKKSLYQNLFFQLYFSPIYRNYLEYKNKGYCDIYFSALNDFISYSIDFELEKVFVNNKKVLRIKGKDKLETGQLDIVYKLNKETNEIFSIVGNFSTKLNKINYGIDFEMYSF